MSSHLLLWALGIGMAAYFTALTAGFLDNRRPHWPLFQKLIVASLAMPAIYSGFLLLIALPIATFGASDRDRALAKVPSYLHEAVLIPALKLWLCGAVSAALLGCFRARSSQGSSTSPFGRLFLTFICVVALSAIIVPMGMHYWIGTGHISPVFLLFFMALAFLTSGLPLAVLQLISLRRHGLEGLRQIRVFFPAFGVLVAAGGYIWHGAIAERPGAWAAWPLTLSALAGVLVAWLNGQRALRVGEAKRIQVLQQIRAQKQSPDG
jgi:hypothetical protein